MVVGVTSHGPDCQSQPNNPNYAYGFYTGMKRLLNLLPHACVRMHARRLRCTGVEQLPVGLAAVPVRPSRPAARA